MEEIISGIDGRVRGQLSLFIQEGGVQHSYDIPLHIPLLTSIL